MPIEFSICLDRDLVYARWFGAVDFDQFTANFARYVGDANYRPGRRELIDQSLVTTFEGDPNLMRSMLRRVNEQAPSVVVKTHTVIYSPQDTLFGLGRMYQILAELAEGIQVEVFKDEREALEALRLPHASISQLLETEDFIAPRLRGG
ncbi:hypothetical protein A8B78_17050 [Jannaschia sp. EhC01]|nr:hypothetical protein A8B78_17050 [Jannaschia sp. EhC01]